MYKITLICVCRHYLASSLGHSLKSLKSSVFLNLKMSVNSRKLRKTSHPHFVNAPWSHL